MFKSCHFARAIWFGSPVALRMDGIKETNFIEWLSHSCTKLIKLKVDGWDMLSHILITLDTIWNMRNNMIWKGEIGDQAKALRNIYRSKDQKL